MNLFRSAIEFESTNRPIDHFRVFLCLRFKTSPSAKMSSACSFIFLQIKVIFIRMVSHLDSLWNRGTREHGNGLFRSPWPQIRYISAEHNRPQYETLNNYRVCALYRPDSHFDIFRGHVLRYIVLGWILIYQNYSWCEELFKKPWTLWFGSDRSAALTLYWPITIKFRTRDLKTTNKIILTNCIFPLLLKNIT